MELEKFLIGLLVFVFFIVGGMMILTDINTNYASLNLSTNTSEFDDVNSAAQEIYNTSYDMGQSMNTKIFGGEIDDTDTVSSMYKGGYGALRLIGQSIGLVGKVMNAIATKIGIPGWMIILATTALLILIIFAIIYLVFGIGNR